MPIGWRDADYRLSIFVEIKNDCNEGWGGGFRDDKFFS
jgi:hypothetical protein